MTVPQRISVKIPTSPDPGADFDLEPCIRLFHRFIQAGRVEGLLIDVADYAHVPDGPGVILIGHDVDYGIDQSGGQTGLLVTRKRYSDLSLVEVTRDLFRKAFIALEAIRESESPLRFATDRAELRVLDRLHFKNDEPGFRSLLKELEAPLREVFGGDCAIGRAGEGDAREPLGLTIEAPEAVDVDAAIEQLGGRAELLRGAREIEVDELKRLRDQGMPHRLIDVREPDEFETCNIGGELIPLGSLEDRLGELDKSTDIVVHCKSGPRGAQATELLRNVGFDRVRNVRGGILAWIEEIDPSLPTY